MQSTTASARSIAQPDIMQRLQPTISNTSTLTTGSNLSSFSSSPSSPSLNALPHYQKRRKSPSENDNKVIIALCNQYLKENNHLGLAFIARERGVPPSLRHQVWPVLLKYHPYVVNPYLSANVETEEDIIIPEGKIRHELMKYFRVRHKLDDTHKNSSNEGSNHTSGGNSPTSESNLSPVEEEIIRIMEASVEKFFNKWGGIIKYDSGFAWIALNLAEWFPPIPNSNFVLIGRDVINKTDSTHKHLIQLNEYPEDGSEFLLDANDSRSSSENTTRQAMSFAEVYERLTLVLLHSHEDEYDSQMARRDSIESQSGPQTITDLIASNSLNSQELLFKSGNIETRISFFIVIFDKLLPELYKYLSEEDIINKNSNKNNQWLTWWFKYCGAKVFNKLDRGRMWDLLLGFRYPYEVFADKFSNKPKLLKKFQKLYDVDPAIDTTSLKVDNDNFWHDTESVSDPRWSKVDYQIQLAFIYISILQKNESKLLEFDQFEITEFLNKLPVNQKSDVTEVMLQNTDFVYDDFERLLKDAGELWRHWVWNEITDENINN